MTSEERLLEQLPGWSEEQLEHTLQQAEEESQRSGTG
jgi:hypothetical protein